MSEVSTVRVQQHFKKLNDLVADNGFGQDDPRIQRYGLYWNAVANVDIRQRTGAVNRAFHLITEALKDTRKLMLDATCMPANGWNKVDMARQELRLVHVNLRLDQAWVYMTTDPVQGMSCFDADWDPKYQEPRDIDARDTHMYEG